MYTNVLARVRSVRAGIRVTWASRLEPASEPPVRSKKPFGPASEPSVRLKWPLWPTRCRHFVRKGCSSLLQCRQCVRKGCSILLFKITIHNCWTRLHCALRLFAQLSLLRAWICTGPHLYIYIYIYVGPLQGIEARRACT